MNKKRFSIVSIIALGVIMFSSVNAQSKTDDKESARVFVQKFYDWYLVLWAKAEKHPYRFATSEIAVSQKPDYFDRALRSALAEDYSAQNKSGDIVGLDFDPFLRCQELWGGYQVGNVKRAGGKFWVDIHNIEKGKLKTEIKEAPLRVVVELVKRNGHWVFINFIYPTGGSRTDLLETLKGLKADRDNPS